MANICVNTDQTAILIPRHSSISDRVKRNKKAAKLDPKSYNHIQIGHMKCKHNV